MPGPPPDRTARTSAWSSSLSLSASAPDFSFTSDHEIVVSASSHSLLSPTKTNVKKTQKVRQKFQRFSGILLACEAYEVLLPSVFVVVLDEERSGLDGVCDVTAGVGRVRAATVRRSVLGLIVNACT